MIRLGVVGLLLGALTGCHAPPPPAPIVAPAAPPPAVVRRVPEAVSASWSFAITETACVAHASSRDVSLTIRTGHNNQVELSVAGTALRSLRARSGARARLRFEGAAGSWTLPARSEHHRVVVAVLHLSEPAANNVLVLLGGGSLRTEVGKDHVPVLRIPDSDVSGREWFDCVRRELRRVNPAH